MINRKNSILYIILLLLLLLASVTSLVKQKSQQTTQKNMPVDINDNYTINTAPLKKQEQGSIDSH